MKAAACLLATAVALGMSLPAFAGDVTETEHDTYEKHTSKVETIPPPVVTERRTEESTETSRTDSPRRDRTIIEKRTVVPGRTETERKTETETRDGD